MASSDSAILQKVIVLCPNAANTSASVISKISLTNEVWATFLPTQIILTVLWCTDVSFSTAFLHYCASEASLIRNFWPAVGCGAVLLTSTRSNIQSAQQQAWLQKKKRKRPKDWFFSNLAQTQAKQELPPIQSLWKSHMSLHQHSNRTTTHLSLIMQMIKINIYIFTDDGI